VGRPDPDASDDVLEGTRSATVAGTVLEILPRALYRVAVGNGREVVAHAPGGFGRNFVRLVVGDRVTIALSPRDARRGRIVEKR
jgi:translation initiation factor IF-1